MNNIIKLKIREIDSFKDHPFKVVNDDSLMQLAQSIKDNGLLVPIVVRKKEDNRYEIISGHRRKAAVELNGEEYIDAIIKDLTYDEAVIEMVDSNIYREKILPSEKAKAYKMKLDAIKHQGKSTSTTELSKLRSNELVGKSGKESREMVRRYIRLTYLIPELLEMVDNTVLHDRRFYITMGVKPAVELSYLNIEEQKMVYSYINLEDKTPSFAQSKVIREMSKNKTLTFDSLDKLMSKNKGNQEEQISFNKERIIKALPFELINKEKQQIEKYIILAINYYKKYNKKDEIEEINIKSLRI